MAGDRSKTVQRRSGDGARRAASRRPARRSSARGPASRRAGAARPPRRRPLSDLNARLLAAVPAIAFALLIVIEGGPVFALGLFALGCICMHELYRSEERRVGKEGRSRWSPYH